MFSDWLQFFVLLEYRHCWHQNQVQGQGQGHSDRCNTSSSSNDTGRVGDRPQQV